MMMCVISKIVDKEDETSEDETPHLRKIGEEQSSPSATSEVVSLASRVSLPRINNAKVPDDNQAITSSGPR